MSKLSDKIKKVTRIQSQSLGFGSMRATSEPTMLLAAAAKDSQTAGELSGRGADVIIMEGVSGSPPGAAAAGGVVFGARIEAKADHEAQACKDAGYDFVIFDPDRAAATALLEENIGYVLTAPRDMTDAELRTLESFQLDAIDIGQIDGSMTVRQQIELRRIYGMTRKPLMAAVRAGISATSLQALRDTNVVVAIAEDAGAVEHLRKTIDALPPRARRKDGEDRPVPLVPQSAGVGDGDDDHDHEHDE